LLLMPRWAGDVDLRPLCRALRECGIDASQIPRIAERLSRPSLMLRAAWRTGRKGRPADIDFALAAYLIALLCEATGRRFPLSHGRGPMWRALIEALALAQVFLARRYGPPFLKCSCKRDLFRDRFFRPVRRYARKNDRSWLHRSRRRSKAQPGDQADNSARSGRNS